MLNHKNRFLNYLKFDKNQSLFHEFKIIIMALIIILGVHILELVTESQSEIYQIMLKLNFIIIILVLVLIIKLILKINNLHQCDLKPSERCNPKIILYCKKDFRKNKFYESEKIENKSNNQHTHKFEDK